MAPPDGDSTPDPGTRSREGLIPYVAIVAVLAGLLFGVDPGVISGALDHIGPSSRLGDFGTEAVVPSVLLAGFVFVGLLECRGRAPLSRGGPGGLRGPCRSQGLRPS